MPLLSDLPAGIFIKRKKAGKNASDVPKAAPAAQKTPAVHAAAVNIEKNNIGGFAVITLI